MDAALVAGCTATGVAAGGLLDVVAARVRPAQHPHDGAVEVAGPAAPGGDVAGDVGRPGAGAAVGAAGEVAVGVAGDSAVAAPAAPATVPEVAGVGLLTALLLGLAAARLGPVPALAAYVVLFAGLVAVSVVDVRVGLLPRAILYPAAGLAAVALLAASAVDDRWGALGRAAICGAVALVVFFAIWWVYPRGLGFGDVRLAAVMAGALGWLGYDQVYVGFVAGFLVGAVIGLVKMAVQGTGRKTRLPFGPALAAGCVVGVLWGAWFAHLWVVHST